MCFAGIEALITTPIAIYFTVVNVKIRPLYPWISWEHSHSGAHIVGQYPAIIWHKFPFATAFEFLRWIHVLAAFIFFFGFGFVEEAKSHYRLVIKFFLKVTDIRLGRQTGPNSPGNSLTNPRVPTAVERENKPMPSTGNTQNPHSELFLNLDNDSSPHFAHSSETDTSTIEKGRQ
jgi:hypothetical protein